MKKTAFILIAIFSLLSINLMAQSRMDDMLRRRAAEKVGQMNDYISFMADKKNSVNNRQYYSKQALKLFIAKGEAYTENDVKKEGVIMEVTSVKKQTKNQTLMKTYFQNLMNLKYSNVKISSTDVANIKVSSLQKIAEGQYVCTCQYDQSFVGYKDGVPVYKDITTKRIKCYVFAEKTEDGTEYIILLGDATCECTVKG